MALSPERLKQGLTQAFDAFLDRYADLGGNNSTASPVTTTTRTTWGR